MPELDVVKNKMSYQSAKEMFWDYSCSHLYICHDGHPTWYEYLNLGGGDKEKEIQWRKEFIEHWVTRLSPIDLEPMVKLCAAKAHESIKEVISISVEGDDLTKLLHSLHLEKLSRIQGAEPQDAQSVLIKAFSIWEDLVTNPTGLSPESTARLQDHGALDALNARSPEEYIQNYALSKINQYKHNKSVERNGE